MAENLRHWKDNCNALGYDSDGEQLSLATPVEDGSEDGEEVEQRKAEASAPRTLDRGAARGHGIRIGRIVAFGCQLRNKTTMVKGCLLCRLRLFHERDQQGRQTGFSESTIPINGTRNPSIFTSSPRIPPIVSGAV